MLVLYHFTVYHQISKFMMGGMMKKAREMSPLEVGRLEKPGLYFVGKVAGLILQVAPSGARNWILRIKVGAKRRDMGLGGFPDVTLAGAHKAAREAREKVKAGIDPIAEAKAAKSALIASQVSGVTFDYCATEYIKAKEAEWSNAKHAQQWRNTLDTYARPVIGKMLVRDVTTAHILKILTPLWVVKTETATRVRGRIESVIDWATAREYRVGLNPARWKGHMDKLLAKPRKLTPVEHHAALPVAQVGEFLKSLRDHQGMGARALEFAILTAARSGEVRGAAWGELDLVQKVWTVPASRMKLRVVHRVPLSDAALNLLRDIPKVDGSNLVFNSPRGKQLSDMTLAAVLRRMGIDAVPHGFRSTFRDWCAEKTNFPREVAEAALAHGNKDQTEAAYLRSDMYAKRCQMMNAWAAFCAKPEGKANVVSIRGRGKVVAA